MRVWEFVRRGNGKSTSFITLFYRRRRTRETRNPRRVEMRYVPCVVAEMDVGLEKVEGGGGQGGNSKVNDIHDLLLKASTSKGGGHRHPERLGSAIGLCG